MKWLNDLFGFAVLSAGYLLLLAWLPIAIWVAVKLAKRFKSRATRIAGGVGLFLLFFVLPFGDEIVGRIYLSHLCATQPRVMVFQAVELPLEYWDERGRPKYLGRYGFVDMKLLPDRFEWRNINEPYLNSVIKVERWRSQFFDKETKTVLGERITYMRHFGWMNRFSLAPTIGESCRELVGESNRERLAQIEREQEQQLFSGVLKPPTPNR